MTPPRILCIDIGSTHLKAALLDSTGTLGSSLGVVRLPSPLQANGVPLQAVLATAAHAATRACASHRPDAIAITGATRTTAFVDAHGVGLAPLMKLDDASAARFANTLRAQLLAGTADLGGALDFHPISRLLYFVEHTIEQTRGQSYVLEMKDAINLALCGVAACDPVTHARQDLAGVDAASLLARLGLPSNALPPSHPAGTVLDLIQVDPASPWHRFNGVPVIECGFDAWCATLGMGAVKAGTAYNVCGTTDVFGSFAVTHGPVPGASDLPWACGLRHLGGPCATGLGTLAWFGQQYLGNADPAAVVACASAATGEPPLCVPFVGGERMPYWQADLTASFLGLQRHHGLPDMARALVDGLLVFNGWLLHLLEPQPQQILLGGGGAHLTGWASLKAAAFESPVQLAAKDAIDAGLLGAAMCGSTALREFGSLALAQDAMGLASTPVHPDPAHARRLQAVSKRLLPHFPEYPPRRV